ncbi:hypothetical protein Drorol1_Dr00020872 [Drosera rotundifolia]
MISHEMHFPRKRGICKDTPCQVFVFLPIRISPAGPRSGASRSTATPNFGEYAHDQFSFRKPGANGTDDEGPALSKLGSNSTAKLWPKAGAEDDARPTSMPPASVMTRLILIMVWRKLVRNPNTYSSLIGLTLSLISFRWHIEMPAIVAGSIAILSNADLGMTMFSLGLFMALQPRIIACGNSVASFAMAVRFITRPAVMAAASIAVGLRGVLLHIVIVQGTR